MDAKHSSTDMSAHLGGLNSQSAINWGRVQSDLNTFGWAHIGPLVSPHQAQRLRGLYDEPERWRSHIIMRRHGFGEGEYKYFAAPLPKPIQDLRTALYPPLAQIANHWQNALGTATSFPTSHAEMLARCHADGQTKPTPLMLKYEAGDYNCLHQDLYGRHVFPLQVVILLSDERDFEGGEFVLVEQRPRMQSRAEVVHLRQGHGVVFAVSERPRNGTKGVYRVKMRHGVSRIKSGQRITLGVIFHDAA